MFKCRAYVNFSEHIAHTCRVLRRQWNNASTNFHSLENGSHTTHTHTHTHTHTMPSNATAHVQLIRPTCRGVGHNSLTAATAFLFSRSLWRDRCYNLSCVTWETKWRQTDQTNSHRRAMISLNEHVTLGKHFLLFCCCHSNYIMQKRQPALYLLVTRLKINK